MITKYEKNLLFYKIFIDNMFGIWIRSYDPNAWEKSKENLPFSILIWEVEERMTSVNFLDLTISINKYRKIDTRTHQKTGNSYLYLPSTSAQPLRIIRGMTYGMIRKYDEQNSHRKHYIEITVLLFRRLATCRWDTTLLQRIFNNATAKVDTKCPPRT